MAIAGVRIEALAPSTPDVRIPAPEPVAASAVKWKPGRKCDGCPYRETCAALVKARLPVLCERLTEKEVQLMEEIR